MARETTEDYRLLAERMDRWAILSQGERHSEDMRKSATALRSLTADNAQVTRERDEARNPCSKIFEHKWLSADCVETGCQSLAIPQLTAEIAALKLERDALKDDLMMERGRVRALDALGNAADKEWRESDAALRARVEALEGALRPFGKIGNWLKHSPPETRLALADPKNIPGEHLLTAEQFYRAFAALSPSPPAEGGDTKSDAPRIAADGVPVWPSGCRKPGSCERHRSCAYMPCVHKDRDIQGEIDLAVAAKRAEASGTKRENENGPAEAEPQKDLE